MNNLLIFFVASHLRVSLLCASVGVTLLLLSEGVFLPLLYFSRFFRGGPETDLL